MALWLYSKLRYIYSRKSTKTLRIVRICIRSRPVPSLYPTSSVRWKLHSGLVQLRAQGPLPAAPRELFFQKG